MKNEDKCKNIIHDVGESILFSSIITVQNKLTCTVVICNSVENPKSEIDATGSIVKKFRKIGLDETKRLFLYEARVYDSRKKQTFAATFTINESHSNVAISNWLLKRLK